MLGHGGICPGGARRGLAAALAALTLLSGGVVAAQEAPPDSSTTSTEPTAPTEPTEPTQPSEPTEPTTPTSETPPVDTTPPTDATESELVFEPQIMMATVALAAPTCRVDHALTVASTGPAAACVEEALAFFGHIVVADANLANDVAAVHAAQQSYGWAPSDNIGPSMLNRLGIYTPPPPRCVVSYSLTTASSGTAARCVEIALAYRGYLIVADANLANDIGAVHAAQQSYGWAASNHIGPAMLGRLGIYAPPPLTCRVRIAVVLGAAGPGPSCIEQALQRRGYTVTLNGVLDTEAESVYAFQRSVGWATSSQVGPAMLGRLEIYTAPDAPPSCRVSATVSSGSTGAGATCVEQRLAGLGLPIGGTRGLIDATDVASIRAFQSAIGIAADGVAGPTTLNRLGIYNPNPTGLPSGSGTGRRVVYHRGQQRVWAVDAGGNVLKTHRVSGRLYEPYRGTYSVFSRSLYTHSNANPDIKWRYMIRFTKGPGGDNIGFHEIPTRFGVPLQTVAQLGQPLSGGCVRQSTPDAQWMWNWAGIGTKVVVL